MRLQPWTEAELMLREAEFEALTQKAVEAAVRTIRRQLVGPLTASVELPGAPPETAPEVSFTSVEGAVMAVWSQQVEEVLYPFLVDTFVMSAETVVDGLEAATGAAVNSLTNVYAQEFLAYAQNRMVGIGQKLWEEIRAELSAGFSAGEGIKEIAQRLQTVAGLSTPRALTTARTEVISAANAGSYLQMIEAGFEDDEVTKVWLATEDPRTRKSHRHADNQGVQLTGEFALEIYSGDVLVGEEFVEFPGDPSGTPGNIINCRCSLAFDFNEDAVLTSATWVEKQHPRDKDGKFKKKGAPDLYVPKLDAYDNKPSTVSLIKNTADKINQLKDQQASIFVQKLSKEHWNSLSDEEKQKVATRFGVLKGDHIDAAKAHLAFLQGVDEPDDSVDTDAPSGARALGGTVQKTGKKLEPGKPVFLRVQLLYQTDFEDGAVMAVRKESDERIVFQGGKILRQKKGADGKFKTTQSFTKKQAYDAWKDEGGWTIPDPSAQADTPSAPAGVPSALGKPVAIKVKLIYQTEFNDGDTVAVNPGTGERITWDAAKKRMIVHDASGSTTEYTRGALYKAYKDSDGWFLPGDQSVPSAVNIEAGTAPKKAVKKLQQPADPINTTPTVIETTAPAPVVTPYVAPKTVGGAGTETIKKAIDDPNVPVGTVLFETKGFGITQKITKTDDGALVEYMPSVGFSGKAEITSADAATTNGLMKGFGDAKKNAIDKEKAKVVLSSTPAAIQSSGFTVTDNDVEDIKDLFNGPNTQINDLLYDSPSLEIEKLTDDSVMVTHKESENFTSFDIDDLTAEKLNDFYDTYGNFDPNDDDADEADAAPTASAGAMAIFNAWENSTPGVSADLYDDAEIDVVKVSSGKVAILKKNDPTTGAIAAQNVTPANLDKAIKAVKAGLSFNSAEPIPEVGGGENGAPGPSQSVLPGQTAVDIAQAANDADPASIEGLTVVMNDPVSGFSVLKAENSTIGIFKTDGSGGSATIEGYDVVSPEQIQKAMDALNSGKFTTANPYKDVNGNPASAPAPVLATPAAVGALAAKLPVGQIPDVSKLKATGQTLGTHGGKVYKDEFGDSWLFKGAPSGFKAAADVDLVTAKLHVLAGLPTPDTGIVTINGQTGSIQKIIPEATTPWGANFDPKKLTPAEIKALQKEHVFDWLVANHDAHAMNLLKDKQGNVIGIDKGQAFKWLGQDKLNTDFKPNEHPQAANVFFSAMEKGQVYATKDAELNDFIGKLQSIPDDEYKALLRPYAEQAAKEGKLGVAGPSYLGFKPSPFPANNVEAFLDFAVARKNSLATTFDAYYGIKEAQFNQAGGVVPTINPPSVSVPTQIPGQAPKSVPIKLSASVLTGPKSTKYTDGQVIAENPSAGERIYWSAATKKYVVQAQDANGKWSTVYSYNKSAALKNLQGDSGWMTPTTPNVFHAGDTPGTAPAPSISGTVPLQPETLQKKAATNKPKSLFGPDPKFTVEELQKQADKRNAYLTEDQKNSLYTLFRTKGAGGASTVKLASSPADQFEGLLEAYLSWNKGKPSYSKVSFLQILRAVDETAASKAGVTNNNAFEKKIIDWLQTEQGKLDAIKIANQISANSGADKDVALFNKTLDKFVKTAAKRANGTSNYKLLAAQIIKKQQAIKPHVEGTKYRYVNSVAEGAEIGKKMDQMYGKLPSNQVSAITKYTGSSYVPMNEYLRTFGHESSSQGTSVRDAEAGMRPIPEAITLHRNVGTVFDTSWKPNVAQLKEFVGVTFREDAFASTSIDGQAFNGHPYRFIIEIPEGTPLGWAQNISQHAGEKEFLLGSGLHYEILEVVEGKDWNGPGATTQGKTAVIRMRVVPPPPGAAAQLGVTS